MGDSRTRRRTGGSLDLSCQTFGPIATQLWVISKVYWRAEPISGGEELEVQPPDFNRLKCKPVSSAVRKQIENFVPLVPYRTRRFSWTRFWTVDTLDAEQDPRRRHNPDTVFFFCGFNTMGEFSVGSGFFFSLSGMQREVQRQGGEKIARYCLSVMFWRVCLTVNPVGTNQQTELLHASVTHEFWHWAPDIRVEFSLRARQLSVSY